jgi:AraC family transcriptional regulator
MEHKIVDKPEIILAGMTFYGDPFKDAKGWSSESEIGMLWGRFSTFFDKHKDRLKNLVNPNVGFEVHIEPEEYAETKNFYVMVGAEVDKIEDLPLELSVRVLPATTYAVFTLKGDEISSNWPDKIYKDWLPSSGYQEAYKVTIERYDERFKGAADPESELEIHVPVEKVPG